MAEENQDPIGDEAAETIDDAVQEPEVLDGADAEEPQEKKKKSRMPCLRSRCTRVDGHLCRYGNTAHGFLCSHSLVHRNGRPINHQNA